MGVPTRSRPVLWQRSAAFGKPTQPPRTSVLRSRARFCSLVSSTVTLAVNSELESSVGSSPPPKARPLKPQPKHAPQPQLLHTISKGGAWEGVSTHTLAPALAWSKTHQ